MLSKKDRERFWKKVNVRGIDDCWEWTAGKIQTGYGAFKLNKYQTYAHRIVYREFYGDGLDEPDPRFPNHSLTVMHDVCDNPGCCNPYHIRLGTHKDNMLDRKKKDRGNKDFSHLIGNTWAQGTKHGKAKLTEEQVLEIRKKYTGKRGEQSQLARDYGVTQKSIWDIVNRNQWKHI